MLIFLKLSDEWAVVIHHGALVLDGLLSRPFVSCLRLKGVTRRRNKKAVQSVLCATCAGGDTFRKK